MEHSNLENDNNYKKDLIMSFATDVSPLVFSNIITDDNPSSKNGLSGLDQVIAFEVGKHMDDIFDLGFVRAAIKVQIGLMRKDLQTGLITEDGEYRKKYYGYELDDGRFQGKIRKIAVGTLTGDITTDNPSKINSLTGYEQVLYYVAHLLPTKDEEVRKEDIERIDQGIQTCLIDFKGGFDLVSMSNNYFSL